jgi:cysteine-rich repeat protein
VCTLATIVTLATLGERADASPTLGCLRRIARATAGSAQRREHAIARCVNDVLDCPAPLAATAAADTDECLARAGARCRRRLGARDRLVAKARRIGETCAAALGSDGFLGEDGLGYDALAPFCPWLEVREGQSDDALACQAAAIACTENATIGALAPRAVELLARAGVGLADPHGCSASGLCGNGRIDGDEECDEGAANSDAAADACRTTCLTPTAATAASSTTAKTATTAISATAMAATSTAWSKTARCGDGVVADGEDCDDGNRNDGDGCDADCLIEEGACGDGVRHRRGVRRRAAELRTPPRPLPHRLHGALSCGDDVVDPKAGEACEPPGTILCTDECALRLPLADPRARPPAHGDPLAACQRALLRDGLRVATRTRALVGRCVQAIGHCLLDVDDGYDRCAARATRLCDGAAERRDRAVARAASAIDDGCRGPARGTSTMLAAMLRDADGLALGRVAATCPFAGPGTPAMADLVGCVVDNARCLGERLVAQTVPRAYELLSELDGDPEERFACVVDPDELDEGSPSGAFVDGG